MATSSTTGFMVGIIGGLLDFASASNLALSPSQNTMGMSEAHPATTLWFVVGLFVLGGVVILTTILSVRARGARSFRIFSGLMIVYGVAMAAIGVTMSTGGIMSAGEIALLYGYGMVIVGVLMLANGIVMIRSPTDM